MLCGAPRPLHTITDDNKDALTDEERAQLLPALDPYNNELVMPLKVCAGGTGPGLREGGKAGAVFNI
jgi:hypothetical protein